MAPSADSVDTSTHPKGTRLQFKIRMIWMFLFFSALLAFVGALAGLLFRGHRRKAGAAALGCFVLMIVSVSQGIRLDSEAVAEGFRGSADKWEAEDAGITDPARWRVQQDIDAKRGGDHAGSQTPKGGQEAPVAGFERAGSTAARLPINARDESAELPLVQSPLPLQAQITVTVSGDAKPLIMGEINLPNNTEMLVSISREASNYRAEELVRVQEGRFQAGPFSESGSDLSRGDYSAEVVTSVPAAQPASVRQVVGQEGENLAGPLVQKSATGAVVRGVMMVKIAGGESPKALSDQPASTEDAALEATVNSAGTLCMLWDATGLLTKECYVSGWNSSVDISVDMPSEEAREFCRALPRLIRKAGLTFEDPGWTVRIYSPYSGENTIATCHL